MFIIKKSPVKRNHVDNQITSQKMDSQIDQRELGQKLRKINVLAINEEDQIEITKEDFE